MNAPLPKCLYTKTDEYTIVIFTQDSEAIYSTESEVLKGVTISLCHEYNKTIKWNAEQYGFSAFLFDVDGFEWHVFTDAKALL